MASLLTLVLGSAISLFASIAIYRLKFHPLASFPGPRLAAVSSFYRIYYDVYKGGRFLNQLKQLHEQYGPVVRCGPNFIHFSDPQAYQEIYRTGTLYLKETHLYDAFALEESTFTFIKPSEHKARRELVSPFFQTKAVADLSSKVIKTKVDQLIDRLLSICHDPATQKQPLNLRFAFRSLALDVITAYCFGSSLGCLTYPDRPSDPQAKLDFKHPVLASVGDHLSHLWLFKWFPIIRIAAQNLPKFVVKRLDPITRANAELGWAMQKQIDDFIDAQKDGNAGKLKDVDHDLIFHRLLTVGRDPTESNTAEPLSKVSILGESKLYVEAGSDTVGTNLYTGMFHAFNNPPILDKLRAEIDHAWEEEGGHLPLKSLERLPYLTAFIKELLRFVPNVETPLPRIPQQDVTISGFPVPAKSVVAISTTFVHRNPNIFPDPDVFRPERWLGPDAVSDQWLCAFSRGSRVCIGQHLAWAEIYLTLGHVLRRLDFEIYNTTVDDMTDFREIFVPVYIGRDFHAFVKERKVPTK